MSANAQVERLDHLGIIAGVIKDLNLIEFIDERIKADSREEISCGEAIAGMIINGLGFSDRPLTLTPQFFENKALDCLFRPGIRAENFNRFKLGRALDDCHNYGCDMLFAQISSMVCKKEGVDTRFNSLDTTAFALTGDYDKDSDEHSIVITHGYSKDHRPDLKQVVLEMMSTHDGAIPIISKTWNGNASDTKIFRERAKDLVDSFKEAGHPRYLIADSKLYDEKTIGEGLDSIPFITRIPSTLLAEQETIESALKSSFESWEILDEKHCFRAFKKNHYGLNQRWIVVYSDERQYKAEKSVFTKIEKEREKLEKGLKKLSLEKFSCSCDAEKALEKLWKKSKFHEIVESEMTQTKKYIGKGRPKEDTPYEFVYQIKGVIKEIEERKERAIKQASCFVVGTTIPEDIVGNADVVKAYKNQNNVIERGFRFLKDPLMFTSSLFVKKTERIMGLLMVMTLSLLVYGIAQRRLYRVLDQIQQTIPNQIHKETSRPTLRWIFQLLEGIEIVKVCIENITHTIVSGLTDLKQRILGYFGDPIMKIYGLNNLSALPS